MIPPNSHGNAAQDLPLTLIPILSVLLMHKLMAMFNPSFLSQVLSKALFLIIFSTFSELKSFKREYQDTTGTNLTTLFRALLWFAFLGVVINRFFFKFCSVVSLLFM